MKKVADQNGAGPSATRRGFLARTAGLAVAGAALAATGGSAVALAKADAGADAEAPQTEPFWGKNQGGIVTPAQGHTYFAALDLTTLKRDDVVTLLKAWTAAVYRFERAGRRH